MDNMLSAALREFSGLLEQLLRNLLGRDAEEWGDELKKFLRKEPCWVKKIMSSYLRLISGGTEIVIGATDGQQTIIQAKEVFREISPDFVNFETDFKGQPTQNISVLACELIRNGTFTQIFGSLTTDQVTLDRLCLSQSQIVQFVSTHAQWLRAGGNYTFFLFKVDEESFVAGVYQSSVGLDVNVRRLSYGGVWDARCRHRIVVPLLSVVNI